MRRGLLVALLALTIACSPSAPESNADGTWVGTITTEGNVTTVINESGSVWGGTARLVEELSIGTDAGRPEYMLGGAFGVWDSGDLILYPDVSVPTVRAYDGHGAYLGDVGRQGQGPGEYQYPFSAAKLSDARIVVTNRGSGWIDVFGPDFEYRERWGPHPLDLSAPGASLGHVLRVGPRDTLYLNYRETRLDPLGVTRGWRSIDADGLGPVTWTPDLEFELLQNCYRADCSLYGPIQFAPNQSATLLPSGATVGGISDDYSFEIRHPDGSVTFVQRTWNPVQLSDDEWNYWTSQQKADALQRSTEWNPSWSDAVPRQKPAFYRLLPAQDERILVLREGPSERVDACTEDPLNAEGEFVPCWRSTQILDLFGADGRFLGEIQTPLERLRPSPFILGQRFTTAVEDEDGTIMVKRYRLVLPGEQ